MKLALLLLFSLLPAYSQLLSLGVKAGVPLTDAYNDLFVPDGGASHFNDHYVIGPTAEIHLPFHLSVEADALYRHSGFGVNGGFLGGIPNGIFSVNDWQVPVLGKYELPFGFGPLHAFADAGPVYRHVSSNTSYPPQNPSSAGFAVGGGVTLKVLHIRIAPEIRYTRWAETAFNYFSVSTANQADFLVGFTF